MGRDDVDITNAKQTKEKIGSLSPSAIINCTGYTKVDQAETEKEAAFKINAEAVKTIAEVSNSTNSLLIHYSTDYVFDGEKQEGYYENDKPAEKPLNVYGESKLQGEKYIQDICDKYYILRTSWLFGKHGNNFIKTVLNLAETKDKMTIVNNEYGKPTSAKDVVKTTLEMIENNIPYNKIYHTVNEGEKISWYDYAKFILKNKDPKSLKKLHPITSEEYNAPATRPHCSFLHNTLLPPLPDWKNSVKGYLNTV